MKQKSLTLCPPEGDFIFRSDNNEVEHHKQPWVKELLESEDDSGVREQRDEHFDGIIVYQRISEKLGGDWLLIKRLPYTSLYQSANEVGLINIGFGLIGLALVIMATFFVSFKITSPIRVLVQSIQQIDKDNMQVPFKSLGNDEIGMLGDRFKQMIERINRLINRELKLEIENKANQLKVLQSQINPHFLYNALQSIGTLALKSNAPKVYALITQLSKIMRYGMDMKEDMVLLEKEVEYIKAYLLLNKERFDDQFQYNLEFDPDTLDCKVPKMIIQPIVENYFKHGFLYTEEQVGQLTIKGEQVEDQLIISVKDNGKGMTAERIAEINRALIEDHTSNSIGLRNVYVRLKLNYGGTRQACNFKV
ncbi:sensor histidine kinase [Gracilibacillus boraciitolerans]|uniref:sensor histidine kinase n=1 Tax=Gracilibacillus boraciitolerans TaxID=307521 RepID=UPI001F36605F|nr:sensor histidine kinase [Gracilibacillus boraciitolerans]